MKGLKSKMRSDKYDVTATSNGIVRTERVSTSNPLFYGYNTPEMIKAKYESFWRRENVKVLKVKKVNKG